MTLTEFITKTNLERSILIGYYGGGNYGDELLLEVLANLLHKQGIQNLTITYQDPAAYHERHRGFGYDRIPIHNKAALIQATLKNKNIIIGGGGLWGVDMNANTFLLSAFLFFSRWFLRKKVYLLGVGFYSSTTWLGRIAGWLAGKAANTILARDPETQQNFSAINKHTYLDSDISWYIKDLDLSVYDSDLAHLDAALNTEQKTLFISPRRPQAKHQQHDFNQFNAMIGECLAANRDKQIIIGLLESQAKSPEEYAKALMWQQQYSNVQVLDFPVNPLALFLFFQKHARNLVLAAPQFHIIITAYLNGIPFMPMVYDNKVGALFDTIGVPPAARIPIAELTPRHLQSFIDKSFRGA